MTMNKRWGKSAYFPQFVLDAAEGETVSGSIIVEPEQIPNIRANEKYIAVHKGKTVVATILPTSTITHDAEKDQWVANFVLHIDKVHVMPPHVRIVKNG